MNEPDVPSPIDLRKPADAKEWERTAQLRPGRAQIFGIFLSELQKIRKSKLDVLELGSGPGFLAEHVLNSLPSVKMTLLDYSAAMHKLARMRLGENLERVRFIERSFKDPGWYSGLGVFDAVITNQAVHELRHKRHAVEFHTQVKHVLDSDAPYLVSDHYCGDGGLANDRLYMTASEQRQALLSAGFPAVDELLCAGSLVIHRAT